MEVIVIMLVGVFFGNKFVSSKYLNIVEKIQFFSVLMLIFLMGVGLGNTENFFNDLVNLGFVSIVYAIVPIIFSTIFVYFLTKKAFGKDKEEE